MACTRYYLRIGLTAGEVREVGRDLCQMLGPMIGRAWKDLPEWIGDLAPEFVSARSGAADELFRLDRTERARLLSPELDTVYHLTNSTQFAQLFLAGTRHSELTPIFTSDSLSRGKLLALFRYCDHLPYREESAGATLRTPWLMSLTELDEHQAILFQTDDSRTLETADRALSRLACSSASFPRHPVAHGRQQPREGPH